MTLLQNAKHFMHLWDWRLFAFILLFLGLPNIYQLYRVRLIGNEIPDPGSLAIVSQWQFIGLVVEVFQEATVLAIFFFLGSQIRSAATLQLDRAKSVLSFIFIASVAFSTGVFLFRDAFIALIGTSEAIQAQTSAFLGISIFSVPFTLLAAAVIVLFEALGLRRLVLIMALVNVALRFALDSLFFGGHGFSLEADVVGVAWSTLTGQRRSPRSRPPAVGPSQGATTWLPHGPSLVCQHGGIPACGTRKRGGQPRPQRCVLLHDHKDRQHYWRYGDWRLLRRDTDPLELHAGPGPRPR